MTQGQAKRVIIIAVVASGALASIKPLTKGELPDSRIAIGVVLLAVILLTLAEISPEFAGAFGLLVLVSALFAIGPDSWNSLSAATKGSK